MVRKEQSPITRPHSSRLGWFALIAVALLFLSLSIQAIWGQDIWWQLGVGRWITENGRLPDRDVFSYTAADAEWIELRWLYCVLAYYGWQVGGPNLLILCQVLILAAAYLIVAAAARRTLSSLPVVLTFVLGICAASGRFVVRPELVSFLFIPIYLFLLESAARGNARRTIWLLPLLQVLWVNTHTVFILGPIFCWLYLFTGLLAKSRAIPADIAEPETAAAISSARIPTDHNRRFWIVTLLVTVACWLNPYGHRGVMFPFKLLGQIQKEHILAQHITEFISPLSVSPASWGFNLWAGAGLVAIGAISFIFNRRHFHPARLLVFLAMTYLAVGSVRNLSLFAIAATMTTLLNLDDYRRLSNRDHAMQQGSIALQPKIAARLGLALVALASLFTSWLAVTDRITIRQSDNRRFGLGIVDWVLPQRSVDFMLENNVQPRVYHTMVDGNYLIWRAADRYQVYVDGRLEVYGDAFFEEYFTRHPALSSIVERWGVSAVLVDLESIGWILEQLVKDPQWVLVHLDARHLLYVRDIPAHADLIARYRIDPSAPWTPRTPEPEERLTGWRTWIGAVGRPRYALGMARTFLTFAAVDNAMIYLKQAIEQVPTDGESRAMLAALLRYRSRTNEAEQLLADESISQIDMANAARTLAALLQRDRRYAEAVCPLEEAIAALPDDLTLRIQLAEIALVTQDLSKAAAQYREAVRLAPDRADLHIQLGLCCEQVGRMDEAITAYRRAVSIDPSAYKVHNQLGILLIERGDFSGARACFERAIQIRPDYESAKANLARLLGKS